MQPKSKRIYEILGVSLMYLSKNTKKLIVDYLKDNLEPKFIYLFGSYARGEGREDSDIDLAIYTANRISPYDLFIISNKLSFEVKRDVQIVDLRDIDTVFAAQIVGTREELYCDDEILKDNYNIRAFKDYAKLNEERKDILDAIERDGRIYG